MSAYTEVETALRSMIGTRIEDALEVPVAYPNARFVVPDAVPWVRAHVVWADRGDLHALMRQTIAGDLYLSVFVPFDSGTSALNALVDGIVEAIEEGDAGPCVFRRTWMQDGASSSAESGWLQRNVIASFTADEVLA